MNLTPSTNSLRSNREGIWAELTFEKTSGTFTKDRETNWSTADRRVPSNDPRVNCATHFCFSSLSRFLSGKWHADVSCHNLLLKQINKTINLRINLEYDLYLKLCFWWSSFYNMKCCIHDDMTWHRLVQIYFSQLWQTVKSHACVARPQTGLLSCQLAWQLTRPSKVFLRTLN